MNSERTSWDQQDQCGVGREGDEQWGGRGGINRISME